MIRRDDPWTARLRRWLRPTTGISGWLVVVFLGQLLVALAGGLILRQLFRDVPAGSPAGQAFNVATLQFLPDWARVLLVLAAGIAVLLYGLRRLMGVLLEPFPDRTQPLVELVYKKRSLARGPRVVAIGGGTGQSTLLRGLKHHTSNITAVVSVADDGGSSGMLRQEMGIAPVGDIRNCIAAPSGSGTGAAGSWSAPRPPAPRCSCGCRPRVRCPSPGGASPRIRRHRRPTRPR